MKIRTGKQSANQGSALAVTLMICVILGILMGSYLYIVQAQQQSVARSQGWNQSIVVAEAGVEEAMALLNSGVVGGNYAVFPWKNAGGGNYTNRISPMQFGDSYYSVILSAPLGADPIVTSTGNVPGPSSTPWISRTIRVQTGPRPTFPVKGPMIVKTFFDANGKNVTTDSFNSTNLAQFPNGQYNPTNASANGDVVSLSAAAGAVKIGNATVKGSVRTPQGGTAGTTSDKTAQIGSNGSVGDSAWVASQKGFQDGHFRDDVTFAFSDATLPGVAVWQPPLAMPKGYKYNGVPYTYVLNDSAAWTLDTLSSSVYVTGTNVVLWVSNSINLTGGGANPPEIHIGPGAALTIYMSGASASIGGNGVINDAGLAKNFAYYGLPSNTSLSLGGNASFKGTIYAPQAVFTLNGSGNNSTDDFTGACITKSTTMTGNFNFHYDESLASLTTLGGFDAKSWEEQ